MPSQPVAGGGAQPQDGRGWARRWSRLPSGGVLAGIIALLLLLLPAAAAGRRSSGPAQRSAISRNGHKRRPTFGETPITVGRWACCAHRAFKLTLRDGYDDAEAEIPRRPVAEASR